MKFLYLRWMIRTALVCFVLGTLLGLTMFLAHRVPALGWAHAYRGVHVHLILVGGVMQMIMGVALWMFPRRKEPPYWPTAVQGWSLYALLNLGTLLRSLFGAYHASSLASYVLTLAGTLLQVAALLYFVALAARRVRGPSLDVDPGRASRSEEG